MAQVVDELRKLEQTLENKLTGRHRIGSTRRCRVPISPFTPNGNAAASRFTQDQCLGSAYTPGLKDGETLAFQRVEWMLNFCPSQRLVGNLGSSH
jgi:hypothetical protein